MLDDVFAGLGIFDAIGGELIGELFGDIFGDISTGLLDSLLSGISESGSLEQLDTLSFGEPPVDADPEVPEVPEVTDPEE